MILLHERKNTDVNIYSRKCIGDNKMVIRFTTKEQFGVGDSILTTLDDIETECIEITKQVKSKAFDGHQVVTGVFHNQDLDLLLKNQRVIQW